MELVFKISTFFKNRFGSEDEINEFCEAICVIAKAKDYSSKVNRMDIIPSILPDELRQQGKGKEFTKVELKYKAVAICRQMDFETYQGSNIENKKALLKECLINAIKDVQKKIDFNIEEFEKDIDSLS